jgi:hypothetical protein
LRLHTPAKASSQWREVWSTQESPEAMVFWKDFSPNRAAKWPISLYQQLTGKDVSWILAVVLLLFLLNTDFSEKYGLDKVIEEDYKRNLRGYDIRLVTMTSKRQIVSLLIMSTLTLLPCLLSSNILSQKD